MTIGSDQEWMDIIADLRRQLIIAEGKAKRQALAFYRTEKLLESCMAALLPASSDRVREVARESARGLLDDLRTEYIEMLALTALSPTNESDVPDRWKEGDPAPPDATYLFRESKGNK